MNTEFFNSLELNFKQLNNDIYDAEYSNFNKDNILSLKLEIKLTNYNKRIDKNECKISSVYDDIIFVEINFDKCNIGSVKFVFNILKPIETLTLIEILEDTCTLVDKCLFNLLKKDLEKVGIESEILKEHITYSIISGDDISETHHPLNNEKELFGIAWNNPNFNKIDEKIINDVLKNSIPIYNNETIIVTTQSTLLLSIEDNDYVNEIIEAIELFWRQKCLIKKIDFQISTLLKKVSKDDEKSFESEIEEITSTQKSLNSELEIFRNTVVSVVQTYTRLFKTLNNVFNMDNHYYFVKAKMEACERIYNQLYGQQQSKYEKERKNIMYNIQWAVLILGFLTLISTIIISIYSQQLQDKNNFVDFILFLICVAVIGIIFYYDKKSKD